MTDVALPAALPPPTLDESFTYCRRLARRTAGNFYYAFRTLPTAGLRDTCALYAFTRIADDLGDDETRPLAERRQRLDAWRAALHAAVAGDTSAHPCLPALADVIDRHAIPPRYVDDVLTGIASDLDFTPFETFEELAGYCYHVAGAVGVSCIHVWGMQHERAIDAAVDCGLAFQLTNVLRDLGEDARTGRVYLPAEDLRRFDYTPDDLANGVRDERFRALMQFETARAREFYARGERLFDDVRPEARPILSAMIRIYRGLLDEIERRDFDVFRRRVRLSRARKLWIAFDTMLRGRVRPKISRE
jgi:15-cis-phytoene synthase